MGETIVRILSAIAALALVLVLAYLFLRWLNRRVPGVGAGSAPGKMITVLDRVTLSRTSSILLVRVQDRVFLVGISEHAIETLAELDDPEGKLKLPDPGDNPTFSAALKDAVGKMGFGSKKDKGGRL